MKAEITLDSDLKKAYSLVYGQCSDALRAKLESINNQSTIAASADVLGLLRNIKSATFSFQSQKYERETTVLSNQPTQECNLPELPGNVPELDQNIGI